MYISHIHVWLCYIWIILVVIFRTVVLIFIVVIWSNVLVVVSSRLLLVFLVYLGIEMIQPGKSFLKFDCGSNTAFKKYEELIQIMTSYVFHTNPRSITRSMMKWIWNVKSNGISYSPYFLKTIPFKNNLIWPFQLSVPSLYLVNSRGQHSLIYVLLLWHIFSNGKKISKILTVNELFNSMGFFGRNLMAIYYKKYKRNVLNRVW